MKKQKRIFLILVLMLMLILMACTDKAEDLPAISQKENEVNQDIEEDEMEEIDEIPTKESIDLTLKPNESGDIMIIMYHNIGEEESEWQRTVENFKKDLVTLYEKGYRAVSLRDYINNDMDVEAGLTPIVLTFDDGNENNFRMIEDQNGEYIIDPNSVIGVLEDFKKQYPDFNTTATFYIFGTNPFRQSDFVDYKLNYLIDNGYDIGNHTIDHRGLKKVDDPEVIQEAIGKQVEFINSILPDYTVDTYALCYGERPKGPELEKLLSEGKYDTTEYKKIGILNVGWNPAPSPISQKHNPLSLPRIRGSEMKVDNVGLYNWLEYFDKNPEKRYISDGIKEIITVPIEMEETIDREKIKDKELYIYEEE